MSLLELASPNLTGNAFILAAMKILEGYRFSAAYSLSDPCDRCRVQAGIEVARMHADHLLPAVTQALASLPIDVENGLALVEQEEAIRRVIDEAAEAPSLARSASSACLRCVMSRGSRRKRARSARREDWSRVLSPEPLPGS